MNNNETIILFNPVVLNSTPHVIDLDKYRLERRFGSRNMRAKLIIEYVCNPLDITVEQAEHFMKRICNEVNPDILHTLELGTCIAYQRKDNGKFVKGPVIIKHVTNSEKNEIFTLVGYENNGTYLSNGRRKKIAEGMRLAPTRYTNYSWMISSISLDRLFIVKSEINMLDNEVNTLKESLNAANISLREHDEKTDKDVLDLKELLTSARNAIVEKDEQIVKLTNAISVMKSVLQKFLTQQESSG